MTRMISAALVAVLFVSIAACRKTQAKDAAAQTAQPGTPAAPAKPEPATPVPAELPDVLARVNGEAVKKTDFQQMIKNMEEQRGPVPPDRRDEVYRGALDQLVTYTVLTQETKARNIAVTEPEIDVLVQNLKQQMKGEAEFQKELVSRGLTEEKLREDMRINARIKKMIDAEVATVPAPTEADARDFYMKNPDKFQQPEALRASHILIPAAETADEALKKKARVQAEEILKKLKAGEDFATLAKQHSSDGSAQQGGDLGFFGRGRMVPPFDQAAFALPVGEISGIVETQFGYHIIKSMERRPASVVPFEQVDAKIRDFLSGRNKKMHADSFVEGLKKKARIEVLI